MSGQFVREKSIRRGMYAWERNAKLFGEIDESPFAPLHRRLGIKTQTYRVPVLNINYLDRFQFDPVNQCGMNDHLFRVSVTLAAVGTSRGNLEAVDSRE